MQQSKCNNNNNNNMDVGAATKMKQSRAPWDLCNRAINARESGIQSGISNAEFWIGDWVAGVMEGGSVAWICGTATEVKRYS